MKIYISGPIAGIPDHAEKFNRAERHLRSLDFEVCNPCNVPPHEHEGQCPPSYRTANGHSAACFLRGDLVALLECDALFMLDRWESSVGARLEHSVAAHCGMPIYSFHTFHLLAKEVFNGQ